jgi:hypothetical protein
MAQVKYTEHEFCRFVWVETWPFILRKGIGGSLRGEGVGKDIWV